MIPIQNIHPIVVHFPIVFVLTLAALDLVATFRGKRVTGRTGLGNASTGLAVLAGLFAVVAFFFGDEALEFAEASGFHSDIAEIHEHLGMTLAAVLAIWAVVRGVLWLRETSVPGWFRGLIPIVEAGTAALVIVTAYFGGELVYDLGVNVAHL